VAEERPISNILQDLLADLAGIVRYEVRLAKVEVREDLTQALSSGIWIVAGIVVALSAWLFLLWTAVYALSTTMSAWAATLTVAIVMAVASAVLIVGGVHRAKRIQPIPERTVESVKETLGWLKQSTK
jgi:uncharacterized membrane protein YqjE